MSWNVLYEWQHIPFEAGPDVFCHITQSNVCNMTYLDHVHKLITQVLWNCCIDHTRIKLGLFPTKYKFAYILTKVFKSFHSSRLPRSINRGLPCAGQRLATKCQRCEVKRFSKMQPSDTFSVYLKTSVLMVHKSNRSFLYCPAKST